MIMRAIFLLVAIALLAFLAALSVGPEPKKPSILEFRQWTKVNETPVLISDYLDLLCRNLTPQEEEYRSTSPHRKKTITVYVNDLGREAMKIGGTFPKGSAIVKEKRIGKDGPVELSTFMVKRERGFNPACGDWEFGVIDGRAEKVLERGKLAHCMKCHVDKKAVDFTFRSYLQKHKDEDWTLPVTIGD